MRHLLAPPNLVRDQPYGQQRGGVLAAPWVTPGFIDRRYAIMPSRAVPTRGVPPAAMPTRVPFAPLSAFGEIITSPLSPSPTRPIRAWHPPPPPQPHDPMRQGVFSAPWLAPSVDAGPVEDLQTATPGWVRRQEDARVITGGPPLGAVWPGNLVQDTVFGHR